MAGLANGFADRGHEVTVVTNTMEVSEKQNYEVLRGISSFEIFKQYKNAERILEANISLKTILFGLICKRKWYVIHHIHYQHGNWFTSFLKNFMTLFSKNISVSRFIKGTLWGKSIVIPNFYSDNFKLLPGLSRDRDLIFVGRLVSDKGMDLVVNAFATLKAEGFIPTLTIVGEGPEKEKLVHSVKLNHLTSIIFAGEVTGDDLVKLLNQHRFMIIPSNWDEPFGLVALEGLACGNTLLCSNRGGLIESSGGFGMFFDPTQQRELENVLRQALVLNQNPHISNDNKTQHLERHSRSTIVDEYLMNLSNNIIS